MVKRVLSNNMVKHVWAAQSQDDARTSNGNLSFVGPVLYSYSTPIANILPGADGRPVALITTETYSVTTSGQHMPGARDTAHMRTFRVPFLCLPPDTMPGRSKAERASQQNTRRDWQANESYADFAARKLAADHAANISHMLTSYRDEMEAARRKRSRPFWANPGYLVWRMYDNRQVPATSVPAEPTTDREDYGQPGRHLANLRRYCAAFGLPLPEMPDAEADRAAIMRHFDEREARNASPAARARRAREAARRAAKLAETDARRAAAIAKARAEGAEKLALWLAGDNVSLPYHAQHTEAGGAYVRVIGETVETSQGARVPLSAGRMLLRLAAECRAKREAREFAEPVRIGAFHLSAIDAEGNARVGCHLLEWSQMADAAARAGIPLPEVAGA